MGTHPCGRSHDRTWAQHGCPGPSAMPPSQALLPATDGHEQGLEMRAHTQAQRHTRVHAPPHTPVTLGGTACSHPGDRGTLGSLGSCWGNRELGQEHAEAWPAETRAHARRHAHADGAHRPLHSCGEPAAGWETWRLDEALGSRGFCRGLRRAVGAPAEGWPRGHSGSISWDLRPPADHRGQPLWASCRPAGCCGPACLSPAELGMPLGSLGGVSSAHVQLGNPPSPGCCPAPVPHPAVTPSPLALICGPQHRPSPPDPVFLGPHLRSPAPAIPPRLRLHRPSSVVPSTSSPGRESAWSPSPFVSSPASSSPGLGLLCPLTHPRPPEGRRDLVCEAFLRLIRAPLPQGQGDAAQRGGP